MIKRVGIIFVVLMVGLSVGLWLKVRQGRAAAERAPGGSGVIEAVEVDVSPRIAARVSQITGKEGDRVKRGQLLVQLDCREQLAMRDGARARLAAAQARAKAAESQVTAALGSARAAAAGIRATGAQSQALRASHEATTRQVRRIEQLRGDGGATEVDLDRASTQAKKLGEQIDALRAKTQAARSQARAARAQAEAIRRQAEAAVAAINGARAELQRVQALVEECQLKAPIDGVVLLRSFEPGEVAMPGSRLLTLVQLHEVETVFYLPNRDLGAAVAGGRVAVVADAYPDRTFVGRIASVAAEAEFTPRNIQTREDRDRLVYAVRVVLPNPRRRLRPGMPVEVRIAEAAAGAEPGR